MKKILCVLVLLMAFPCVAAEIDLPVTLPIINQSDQAAVRIEVWKINLEDKTVWARLYDSDGKMIVSNRVYAYDGDYKNIPSALNKTEIEFLDGKDPSETWGIETIRLWLDSKQAKDEEGKVLADDPHKYKVGDSKADLLGTIGALGAK